MSIYIFIYLAIYLFIYVFVYLFIYLFIPRATGAVGGRGSSEKKSTSSNFPPEPSNLDLILVEREKNK